MLKKAKILFFIIGILLLVYLVHKIGISQIHKYFLLMGYKFPLIFLPFAVVFFLDTLAWQYSFSKCLHGVRISVLFPIRLIGEAINILTPTAYLGGEPVKAYLLRRYDVPIQEGLASVVISKIIMTIAQVLFFIAGIIASVHYLSPDYSLVMPITFVVGMVLFIAFFLFIVQRKGLFVPIVNVIERFEIKIHFLKDRKDKIKSLDEKIRNFYFNHKKRFYMCFFCYFLAWMTGTFEVYVIIVLMGEKISIGQALIVESAIQLIKLCVFFIPGGFGVLEGGSLVIFETLGFGAEIGLSYGIFRRIRELGWASVGFILLMLYGAEKTDLQINDIWNRKVDL